MKKSVLLLLILGLICIYSKEKDKYFYYFYSDKDISELNTELEKQGMEYKPMYVIIEKDTLEVTQITENGQPYRNTDPVLVCMGVPEKFDYTGKGVFIHFKKYKKTGT